MRPGSPRPGREAASLRPAGKWRTGTAVAGITLAAGALAACGGAASGAVGAPQSITLYSGQHVQTTDALVAGFEKATGITVKVRSDDEDTLANAIVAEGSHSPADVIFTENSQVLEFLQGKGLLAGVGASTLAHTPARYNSPTTPIGHGCRSASRTYARVFAYGRPMWISSAST